MKVKIYCISCILLLIVVFGEDVYGSDFENLSYGRDVLSGKVSPTEKPIETTTKKSGFFGSIKNFFGGGKKTTTPTPEISSSTTAVTPSNKNILTSSTTTPKSFISSQPTPIQNPTPKQNPTPSPNSFGMNNKNFDFSNSIITSSTTNKPDNRRDYVAPIRPNSPNIGGNQGNYDISSSTTSSTIKPDNKRDYVAPTRSPGSIIPQGISSTTSTTTPTTVKPNNRRDYVAPSRPTSLPPVPAKPSPFNDLISVTSTTPSSNRRDYVNPNIPTNKRDYINPNIPTIPGSTTASTPHLKPNSPNIFDDKDFPALGPAKGQKTTPKQPGSSTPKPVKFVPHSPGSPDSNVGRNRNQLATNDELIALSETLLTKDINNQNQHITVNYQGKTRSTDRTDEAPDKLLDVDAEAFESPTIEKMRFLFNNYEIDTSVNEYVTPIERKEENSFIDAVMATSVMKTAMQFLQKKGIVTADPKTHRDFLKTLWFTLYSRGGGRIGSSAFEHVFINEIKNGTVIGMHNWVYFYEEEKLGHADYKGWIRKVDLGNKGTILKFRFNYNGLEKYANTLFIGTSPELEMALYTVCFAVRPDDDCPISLNNENVNIVTHTWKYRGKQLIGSAYPEI